MNIVREVHTSISESVKKDPLKFPEEIRKKMFTERIAFELRRK